MKFWVKVNPFSDIYKTRAELIGRGVYSQPSHYSLKPNHILAPYDLTSVSNQRGKKKIYTQYYFVTISFEYELHMVKISQISIILPINSSLHYKIQKTQQHRKK